MATSEEKDKARRKRAAKKSQELYRSSEKYRRTLRDRCYRSKFGISLTAYEEMLEAQNYVCYICKNPEKFVSQWSGKIRALAVDHCHDTGKVRGLLCNRCNTVLGLIQDSTTLLTNAISYLEKFK